MSKVYFAGLSPASVLAALYNGSSRSKSIAKQYSPDPMTAEEAKGLVAAPQAGIGFLRGRPIEIKFDGSSTFDSAGYDRRNGDGAAEYVIGLLRKTGDPNCAAIRARHESR